MNEISAKQPLSWPSQALALNMFELYVIGYALFYAIASLGLEHGIGIVGFSKAPYLNAGGYFYSLAFMAWGILGGRIQPRAFTVLPLIGLILVCLAGSNLIGIFNHNPLPYIIAWNVYVLGSILLFWAFRHHKDSARMRDSLLDHIFSLPFLSFISGAAALSILSRDNHYQYVLVEVIALYTMLFRARKIEKALGLLIYLLVHLGSGEGFVQIEINRASILSVGFVGFLFLMYRRYFLTTGLIGLAMVGGFFYALTLDQVTIDKLPRNISEAVMLLQGDELEKHVSSFQRVYEGRKVMEDFEGANTWQVLFGMGLGRTVDMTEAADHSVGQHALLGVEHVHNIHFIHYAILHKFGIVGLGAFLLLAASVVWMFVHDFAYDRLDDTLMFFYFYIFYNLMFAMPASNHLIGNPLWPAFLGMLCYLRRTTNMHAATALGNPE